MIENMFLSKNKIISLGKLSKILWKVEAVNYRYKEMVMTKCRYNKHVAKREG
jgi:hypothetical protein